jgi:cob(I)alamin adenosyltransferase
MMKIYTRTGDGGETGLFGGGRVAKDHPRVRAYGDVDELNATLGVALAALADGTIRDRLAPVQSDLFALGAHLATPPAPEGRPELRAFVLPGGSTGAAALHHARTVCRRAERSVVALAAGEAVPEAAIVYLNRLSDLLFTLARLENHRTGRGDVPWDAGAAADGG